MLYVAFFDAIESASMGSLKAVMRKPTITNWTWYTIEQQGSGSGDGGGPCAGQAPALWRVGFPPTSPRSRSHRDDGCNARVQHAVSLRAKAEEEVEQSIVAHAHSD